MEAFWKSRSILQQPKSENIGDAPLIVVNDHTTGSNKISAYGVIGFQKYKHDVSITAQHIQKHFEPSWQA